jgi:hypothetical protein
MAGGRGFETTTGLVIQQGIFEESSTAKHKVGTRMQLADGRVFYYAQAGEALAAGKLAFSKPQHVARTAMVTTTASAAIGAKTITGLTVGAEAFGANDYAEGFLYTQKVTGLGYTYKIKSNTSGTSGGTNLDVVLYDPIQVAIDSTTEIGFVYNPFHKVLSGTATVTSGPAGVCLRGVVTTQYYCWLQTWGVCAMSQDAGTNVGEIGMRVIASTEEGFIANYTTNTNTELGGKAFPHVGYRFGTMAVDSEFTPIMLQLYP